MKAIIGNTETGKLEIDIPRLVETRLLIQANSGGGKSYLLRKILEETHGKVQQIVLDMEGEFATLREKFDYILAGKDGDVPVDPRSAELLAKKVLELNASIIIDLYELKHNERIRFVKLFLDSMVNAPKELWHSVLVVIDEAHVFCPEKGESEAMNAVIDIATRGRKRGFGSILATQRLSKLHKDVAAEMINKLIGRTGLDIDMKRASDELGFTTKQQMLSLRDLEPGEFYAFGPAISKSIEKVKISSVKTVHPKAGQRIINTVPVPTDKVLKILSKLTDLPKEAEKELRTKEEMLKKIRELKSDLRRKPSPEISSSVIEQTEKRAYLRGVKEMENKYSEAIKLLRIQNSQMSTKIKKVAEVVEGNIKVPKIDIPKAEFKPIYGIQKPVVIREPRPTMLFNSECNENFSLGKCEKMILKFLLTQPERYFTYQQIGAMTGYSPKSGSFRNSLSSLKTKGLIIIANGIKINPDEIQSAEEATSDIPLNSLDDWLNTLGLAERKIYSMVIENPDEYFTFEELGERTGYSSISGSFRNSISRLKTLGLIEKDGNGIRFNQNIREFL